MKRMALAALSAGLIGLMAGCGSSSDDKNSVGYNGVFVDSAVAGLSWSCGGVSGTTDANGVFGECPAGSDVTLSVGNIVLGTMAQTADNIFTPQDLMGVARGTLDDAATNSLAALLLSLDDDGDPTNGVSINAATVAAVNQTVTASTNFSSYTQETLSSDIQQILNTAVQSNPQMHTAPVSNEEAASHLNETAAAIENGNVVAPAQPTATTGGTGAN